MNPKHYVYVSTQSYISLGTAYTTSGHYIGIYIELYMALGS